MADDAKARLAGGEEQLYSRSWRNAPSGGSGRLDTNPVTSRRHYPVSTIAPRGAIRDPCSLNLVSRSEETYPRRNLFFGCVPSEAITRGAPMPFSQKPEEISFSDILDADEIASAASRMVRSFVRILTLLIVATLSFVVGVYVGPAKEGKELRALITARITSLRSELHRKIEEVKTAPEEAARPTEPASGEPEPGPLALSPNKPSATPAPTMEGGKTVATPAETPLSPSGPSDSTAVAPAAPPSEQTAAPPVTDTPRAAQAPVKPAPKPKPQPKLTAPPHPKPAAPADAPVDAPSQ